MNKQSAITTIRGIIRRLESELDTCYVGDDTEIWVEIDALRYAIEENEDAAINEAYDAAIVLWNRRIKNG